MNPSACTVLFLAVAPAASAQVGSVVDAGRIREGEGGFVGPLLEYDRFGCSLACLGDFDGDGVRDLAVGAPGDDDGGVDRGAVWILRLASNGTVLGETKISQTRGGFAGTLSDLGRFGRRVAAVGDLNGDGVADLATVSGRPNRLWVLLLRPDGTVLSTVENLYSDPVFVPATQAVTFAFGGLEGLGDVDGDGLGDLAVGAPRDPDPSVARGALWIVRLNADGTLKAADRIANQEGGLGNVIEPGFGFGSAVHRLGDLDSDGVAELGVAVPGAEFGGQWWVLFLDAGERVRSFVPYGPFEYGLQIGSTLFSTSRIQAWLGDLDGDGAPELAMGYPQAEFPGDPRSEGAIAVGSLRPDGSLLRRVRISHERGGMGPLGRSTEFGAALAALGDLDGDGAPELAVGAPNERSGGLSKGAVWILELDTDASRNGAGVNPHTLTQTAPPAFETPWALSLDCSGHLPGAALVIGTDAPSDGLFLPFGELLLGGRFLFALEGPHAGGPTTLIGDVPPATPALLDLPVSVQGVCLGAPGPVLSNALDVVLGEP